MNKFTILGHCNTSIGIILDSLYGVHKNIEIEIISNISKSENIPYLHKNIKTIELYIDDWIPNGNEQWNDPYNLDIYQFSKNLVF